MKGILQPMPELDAISAADSAFFGFMLCLRTDRHGTRVFFVGKRKRPIPFGSGLGGLLPYGINLSKYRGITPAGNSFLNDSQ